MPTTVADLRVALTRERRATDRRVGKSDTRVFQYERRVGQRRELRDGEWVSIDDEMIVEMSIEGDGNLTAGPLKGVRVALPVLRDDYYRHMHWDTTSGRVSKARAQELGIAELLGEFVA